MNTIAPAEVKIALDDTLGAAFLGHFVTTMCVGYTTLHLIPPIFSSRSLLRSLYGITSLQAYLYYRDQTRDSRILRYSVSVPR